MMRVEDIARVCHEVNRAYCESIGDTSQLPWPQAKEWQRLSAIRGVRFALEHPDAGAASLHNDWVDQKVTAGWKFGPFKDETLKEHPCIVSYDELPDTQKAKDILFHAVVETMSLLEISHQVAHAGTAEMDQRDMRLNREAAGNKRGPSDRLKGDDYGGTK